MKSSLLGLLLLVCPVVSMLLGNNQVLSATTLSADNFWKVLKASETKLDLSLDRKAEKTLFQIDLQYLETTLTNAPNRFEKGEKIALTFPMPNGSPQVFQVAEAPLMKTKLQEQFPNIRSYVGVGENEEYFRFSVSPLGLHGILFSAKEGTILFDPPSQNQSDKCLVYFKSDLQGDTEPFTCAAQNLEKKAGETTPLKSQTTDNVSGYRVFDLALACTGEYAQYHGGTVALSLAAMNATMTKVNAILEKELAISFELVNQNHKLIYLSSTSDPYNNFDLDQMITVNQTVCNNEIGINNYEMGHVFGTQGGGLASINAICSPFFKAQGGTGYPAPAGNYYAVNYVAHEIGHQLGANHTHNNTCNVFPPTAVEPGSGTTIMAYTGLCPPNIKFSSDEYYHGMSIGEMNSYLTEGFGSTCGTFYETENNPPSIFAGGDKIIPKGTPFSLRAQTNDVDNDPLTWCWEQMDAELATMPPMNNAGLGPLFRSYEPVNQPERIFPNIDDLVNNNNGSWEVLPNVSRTLSFRCTVRDNDSNGSCTQWDDLELTVDGSAGPFVVTQPNTVSSWEVGSTKNVSWNVANTNNDKVNCQTVDIYLSVDGGYTYPIVLAKEVSNTGQKNIVVPNMVGNSNRIMVKASNNIFFDISNQNFVIVPCDKCNTDLSLSVRACLQGAMSSNGSTLMRDDLRNLNYIPLEEPFSELPGFNLVGTNNTTLAPNLLNIGGNNAVVDWVLLELRASSNPEFVISCQPALIQRDGDVVNLTGGNSITFENLSTGNYYVAIRHRNHLGIMTKNTVFFGNSTVNVDFTSPQLELYGDFPTTTVNGLQAMWLGNTNQNGEVVYQGIDNEPNQTFFDVLSAPNNQSKVSNFIFNGYHQSDVNLDGKVIYQGTANDPSIIFFTILTHPKNDENIVNYIIKEALP